MTSRKELDEALSMVLAGTAHEDLFRKSAAVLANEVLRQREMDVNGDKSAARMRGWMAGALRVPEGKLPGLEACVLSTCSEVAALRARLEPASPTASTVPPPPGPSLTETAVSAVQELLDSGRRVYRAWNEERSYVNKMMYLGQAVKALDSNPALMAALRASTGTP